VVTVSQADMTGAAAGRRRDVERCAAAVTRSRGRRARLHLVSRESAEPDVPRLVRDAFESLGGAFLLFGRHLAARRDLLPAHYALELEALVDRGAPLEAPMVHQLIADALGTSAGRLFRFDDVPFESRAAWQAHRAVLDDGRTVVVRVSHPELARDLDLLHLLERFGDAFAPAHCSVEAFRAAVENFQEEFRDIVDVRREHEALDILAEDASRFDYSAAPRVLRSLTRAGVLTCEATGVGTLADCIRSGETTRWPDDLARLVAVAWVQQATLGRVFPSALSAEGIDMCGKHRVAFTAGPFHSVPSEYQPSLREYLVNAISDPDRACSAFLRQMRTDDRTDVEALRRQFRQVVPFRDSDWCRSAPQERFEHYLWVHWRSASRAGVVPLPHMTAFYRGVTNLAAVVHAISPQGDALRAALTDLRGMETVQAVVSAMDPRDVTRMAGEYLQLLITLPDRMDGVLQHASDGGARVRVRTDGGTGASGRPRSLLLIVLLVFCGTVLLGHGGERSSTVWTRALALAALAGAAAAILEAQN
jgi:predicted unusual protein kinase regulating ubiquinone biosynthesis (AarF/ABC1/UbiB family)